MNGSSGAFAPCCFGAGVSAGCCAAADDDDNAVAALPFDLDRAGGSAGTAGGVAEELRPRAGLLMGAGATTTASGCSGGLDPARSFFSAFPTDVEAARFGMGPAPLREALLLLALAFAAAGCAEGSRLADRGFAAVALASAAVAATSRFDTEGALGTEAARGGASFSGIDAGSSFGAVFSFAFSF